MTQATFDEVLEAIDRLTADEQAELVEVVRRRLAEEGRRRVAQEVRDARSEWANGAAKPASVDEILREIEA